MFDEDFSLKIRASGGERAVFNFPRFIGINYAGKTKKIPVSGKFANSVRYSIPRLVGTIQDIILCIRVSGEPYERISSRIANGPTAIRLTRYISVLFDSPVFLETIVIDGTTNASLIAYWFLFCLFQWPFRGIRRLRNINVGV